jgi:hypothetical protein
MTKLLKFAVAVAVGAVLVFAFVPFGGGKLTLQLTIDRLEPLANGYHYEAWVMIDGLPWYTGKFNVGPDGQLVDLDGNPVRDSDYDAGRDLTDSAMVLITIQPPDVAVGAPQLKATLTAGIPAALRRARGRAPSSLEALSLPAGATPEALFLSIEPAPDDSPLLYSMRPLSAELGAAEGDFANTSAGFPTGTAVIK